MDEKKFFNIIKNVTKIYAINLHSIYVIHGKRKILI